MDITEAAINEIKQRKKEIIKKFADPTVYLPVQKPFTIFMAGSPGAGKTEFSNKFNPNLFEYDASVPIVRIDADEIRKMLPQFNGRNSDEVQAAATIGMEKLFDHIQDHDQNAIVDTTFSDFNKAQDNIRRSLLHKRKVGIFYIHLDPRIAWDYTKIREKKEGRNVSKNFFIDSYFQAKDNVDKMKLLFPKIEVNLIEKELTGDAANPLRIKTKFSINKIDNYLKFVYNKEELDSILVP
jgi:predicted ABC-type ATPase